MRMKKNN